MSRLEARLILMMNIEVSPKQLEYIKNATHRFNGKIGATQCGKTHIDIAHMIPERILERKGLKGLNFIFGVTKETIERNVLEPMRDFWEPLVGKGCISEINNRNIATIFGEKVYCLGAEKASQVAKVRGAKAKYVYIDEIVDIHEGVFSLIKSRMSLPYSVCDFTGNPKNPQHWVKKFIDSDVDVYSQSWTIYDNPFLAPEVIANFEKEYAGTVFFDRYIRGLWQQAEGLVYPGFNEVLHTVPVEKRAYEKYYISVDYGIHNPMSMALWGLCRGVYYRIEEYYHSGKATNSQKTDDEYYEELEKLAQGLTIEEVIVDPTAASFITLIKRKGVFWVKKARNEVIAGIADCNTSMQRGLIKIQKNCVNIIREFGMYSWNDKSEEDEPIKENDHALDEFRYFVRTLGLIRREG